MSRRISLPLPHEDNCLEDDVGRLRDALENLDDYARETDASLAAKSDAADMAQIARALTTKASISAVDAALSLKADKTAVAADIAAAVEPKANFTDVTARLQAEATSRQGDMHAVAQSIEEIYQHIAGGAHSLSDRIDRKLELADSDFRVGTRVKALPYTTQAGLCGYYSTCLNDLGEVLTWGQGNWKQNGSFNSSNNAVPMVVGIDGTRPDGPFVRLFMANNVTYALDGSGNVWAFGKNYYSELGQGDTVNRACLKRLEYFATNCIRIVDIATPTVPYPSDDYQYYSSTLFLSDAGKVYGCGLNNYGQLGVGDTATKTTPVPVNGLSDIVRIASNMGNYACGYTVTKTGSLYSWG